SNGAPRRPVHGGQPGLSIGDLPEPDLPAAGPGPVDPGRPGPRRPEAPGPQRHPADDPLAQAHRLIDEIIGQHALATARREIADSPDQAVMLLVAGPPGTGRGLTVGILTRILAARGRPGEHVWIGHEDFARLGTATAVAELRDRFSAGRDGRLVVLDGLDRLVTHGLNGKALAEELNRLISNDSPGLQGVGFAAPDGYRRLVDADAALAAWWRVVRTTDFGAAEFETLFARLIERRGHAVTPEAARAAGELLAATPGEGQLRNARLATYLADLALDAARHRLGTDNPTIDLPDLPPMPSENDQGGHNGSGNLPPRRPDPLAELGRPLP